MRSVEGAVTAEQTRAEGEGRSQAGRRWLVLAIILGGAFLVMVAFSTANLAVPSMRRTLGASFGEVELVVAGYVLVYALFLIAGGRLGDLYGRKHVFLAGLAIFTLATAACGVAPNVPVLVVARAAQGFGAALMYPQLLAIVPVNGHDVLLVGGRLRSRSTDSRNPGGRSDIPKMTRLVGSAPPSSSSPSPGLWAVWSTPWGCPSGVVRPAARPVS